MLEIGLNHGTHGTKRCPHKNTTSHKPMVNIYGSGQEWSFVNLSVYYFISSHLIFNNTVLLLRMCLIVT